MTSNSESEAEAMTASHRWALRPITPDDLPFLIEVYASTRADELARAPWTADAKAQFVLQQFHAQHSHYQAHYVGANFDLILDAEDRPLGRVYIHRTPNEYRLMEITLLPPYRGRGIGGAIIKALLDEADAAGAPVGLHVERDNPAYRFYARLGFAEVEERGFYIYMLRPIGASRAANDHEEGGGDA